MIVTLTGTVSAISTDALVLEVGGVGYRVFAGRGRSARPVSARTSTCTRTTWSARTCRPCTASARRRSWASSSSS